jgi:hypothetical protein
MQNLQDWDMEAAKHDVPDRNATKDHLPKQENYQPRISRISRMKQGRFIFLLYDEEGHRDALESRDIAPADAGTPNPGLFVSGI